MRQPCIDKGADYLLAVKGNQPTLHQQVRDLISDAQLANDGFKQVDKSHGRTVMQLSWVAASGQEIDPELWPGYKTVGCVVSQRVAGDKVAELEERYSISSRVLSAEELTKTVAGLTNDVATPAPQTPFRFDRDRPFRQRGRSFRQPVEIGHDQIGIRGHDRGIAGHTI